jgi:putative membrane-bound dehydrogenase-like protein
VATYPQFDSPDTNRLRSVQIQPGFRLQLVAAPALVRHPVAIDFDSAGRLFVAEQGEGATGGRVQLLSDTNGDGVFDKSTVYAENLSAPSALVCYGSGVFVAAGDKVTYLSDSKGKGVSDVRQDVYSGFATNAVRHLVWGPDNRIHAALAGQGGTIGCLANPAVPPLPTGQGDFAFDPLTLAMTLEPGDATLAVAFDSAGRRFTCDAARLVQFTVCEPDRAARNPLFVWPQLAADLATPGDFPLRHPASLMVYRSAAFPAEFAENLFIADPSYHGILRFRLRESDLVPALEQAGPKGAPGFLTCRDNAIQPVQIIAGPDGTLYVLDIARDAAGRANGPGRIWRILPSQMPAHGPLQTAHFNIPVLCQLLAATNGWLRDTATRLLVEARATNSIPLLAKELARARSPLARLHALRALDGLNALSQEDIINALGDSDERVRAAAVQLAEQFIGNGTISDDLSEKLADGALDRSLRVRFRIVLALAPAPQPRRASLLAAVLLDDPANPWIRNAVLTAAQGQEDRLLISIIQSGRFERSAENLSFLIVLAGMAGEQKDSDLDEVLEELDRERWAPLETYALARALGEGLATVGRTFPEASPKGIWRKFGTGALDLGVQASSTALRAECLRFVGLCSYGYQDIGDWLLAVLVPNESREVQSAAIASLGRLQDPSITAAFIQRWPLLPEPSQREIIAQLLQRPDRTEALLTAFEQRRIPLNALTDAQVDFLRFYPASALADRARTLFGAAEARGMAEQRSAVLKIKGSAVRGRQIFLARCAGCHRLNGEGNAFGPDLDAAGLRGRAKLLEDILEPTSAQAAPFQTRLIQLRDGRILFGLVSDYGPELRWVRQLDFPPVLIARTLIESELPQQWSLMPRSAAAELSDDNLADLIEWIARFSD